MRASHAALICAAVLSCCGFFARADEVVFKNGDKLTGKIESAADGKLIITTKLAGKITVKLSDVKTFSTDDQVKVKMQDGTLINQKIAPATQEGQISTAPEGGTIQPQLLPIADINKINEPPVAWTGSIVLNGMFARGSTSSDQVGLSINAVRRSEVDRINFDGAYLYARSKPPGGTETTSQDNEYIDLSYNYFFTKQFYGYVGGRVEKDRINNLDLRLTPGGGLGYQWFESPEFNFNTELGAAWVYEKFTNVNSPREQFSVRGAYHVDWSLWDKRVKLFHDLEFIPSVENTSNYLLITDAGIHCDVTDRMFSEFKVIENFDSNPAPGAVKANTQFLVGVGWAF